MLLKFHGVTFSYDQAATPLFENITVHFSPGWTGIIGANGTGKSTLLKLACGKLVPQAGSVQVEGGVVYCAQRTDDPPDLLDDFLNNTEQVACLLRGRLEIGQDWPKRWSTLSHGERKRAQIAVALWQSPEVLAIDEPTNHIDAQARRMLSDALGTFRGIGLLVSHDRELLDNLCQKCLFTKPPGAIIRSGGYTRAASLEQQDMQSRIKERTLAEHAIGRIERELRRRRHTAAQADKKRSKRGIGKKDHDAKAKINHAVLTGKDGRAGKLASQLDGRVEHMRKDLDKLPIEKIYETGIWLPGSRSKRDSLFKIPAGSIPLSKDKRLCHPELNMPPDERIGVIGPNGAGKSTLIRHLMENLNLSPDRVVYLPQEIDAKESREILAQVRKLSREELGRVMTIVNRLGSRPQRLFETLEPSPGELRKILLALGIIRSPHLVIMDEPTNHLDLPAIECLEAALADCPCGLILVSHDFTFLRHLTRVRWNLNVGRLNVGDTWQ